MLEKKLKNIFIEMFNLDAKLNLMKFLLIKSAMKIIYKISLIIAIEQSLKLNKS